MSNQTRKIVFYELLLPFKNQDDENDETEYQNPQELIKVSNFSGTFFAV